MAEINATTSIREQNELYKQLTDSLKKSIDINKQKLELLKRER